MKNGRGDFNLYRTNDSLALETNPKRETEEKVSSIFPTGVLHRKKGRCTNFKKKDCVFGDKGTQGGGLTRTKLSDGEFTQRNTEGPKKLAKATLPQKSPGGGKIQSAPTSERSTVVASGKGAGSLQGLYKEKRISGEDKVGYDGPILSSCRRGYEEGKTKSAPENKNVAPKKEEN